MSFGLESQSIRESLKRTPANSSAQPALRLSEYPQRSPPYLCWCAHTILRRLAEGTEDVVSNCCGDLTSGTEHIT